MQSYLLSGGFLVMLFPHVAAVLPFLATFVTKKNIASTDRHRLPCNRESAPKKLLLAMPRGLASMRWNDFSKHGLDRRFVLEEQGGQT